MRFFPFLWKQWFCFAYGLLFWVSLFVAVAYRKALFFNPFKFVLKMFCQLLQSLQFAFISTFFLKSINLVLGLFDFVSQSLFSLIMGSLANGGREFFPSLSIVLKHVKAWLEANLHKI